MATIYIETTGNDSNDGLTKASAVATYHRALELINDGDTIQFGEGDFYMENLANFYSHNSSFGYFFFWHKTNLHQIIKGYGKKTRLIFPSLSNLSNRLYFVLCQSPYLLDFYDLVMHFTELSSGSYYNCFGYGANFNMYNILFECENDGSIAINYDDDRTGNRHFYNCTFLINTGGDQNAGDLCWYDNCVMASTFNAGGYRTDCITLTASDVDTENYKLLTSDNSVYGVYSGDYSWNSLIFDITHSVYKPLHVYTNNQASLTLDIENTDTYTGDYLIDGKQKTAGENIFTFNYNNVPTELSISSLDGEKESKIALEFIKEEPYRTKVERTFKSYEAGYKNINTKQNSKIQKAFLYNPPPGPVFMLQVDESMPYNVKDLCGNTLYTLQNTKLNTMNGILDNTLAYNSYGDSDGIYFNMTDEMKAMDKITVCSFIYLEGVNSEGTYGNLGQGCDNIGSGGSGSTITDFLIDSTNLVILNANDVAQYIPYPFSSNESRWLFFEATINTATCIGIYFIDGKKIGSQYFSNLHYYMQHPYFIIGNHNYGPRYSPNSFSGAIYQFSILNGVWHTEDYSNTYDLNTYAKLFSKLI